MTDTFEAAPGIVAIDSMMCGREKVTSCYLVEATEPALVETGPTTSLDAVVDGLEQLGVGADDLAHIVVTHIHLDHAGGAGALSPHFPRATVWVHERGEPHLADPTKLVASATRVYGEEALNAMFGPVHPVPKERLKAVADGDRIELGGRSLEVLYTPGHASHHVALLDSRSGGVFVGDALGVFLPDVGVLRPATPPPEFDLPLAVQSIERIRHRQPTSILFSHFGPVLQVEEICGRAIDRMRSWASFVQEALEHTTELPGLVERLRAATEDDLDEVSPELREAVLDRLEILSSYEMNAMGLIRYIQRGSGQDSAERRSATS
jgi:glyoxylase-like metal-dependent hydrolase (beta-lactamase superfamily II)